MRRHILAFWILSAFYFALAAPVAVGEMLEMRSNAVDAFMREIAMREKRMDNPGVDPKPEDIDSNPGVDSQSWDKGSEPFDLESDARDRDADRFQNDSPYDEPHSNLDSESNYNSDTEFETDEDNANVDPNTNASHNTDDEDRNIGHNSDNSANVGHNSDDKDRNAGHNSDNDNDNGGSSDDDSANRGYDGDDDDSNNGTDTDDGWSAENTSLGPESGHPATPGFMTDVEKLLGPLRPRNSGGVAENR